MHKGILKDSSKTKRFSITYFFDFSKKQQENTNPETQRSQGSFQCRVQTNSN